MPRVERVFDPGHHCVMAGGMSKRGSWGSMADRLRSGDAAAAPPAEPPEPPDVKHCWVTDRHGRLPGLLLGWRRGEDGWEGRVVRPVRDEFGWLVMEDWLPAALLDRA
jgi:hypothetical protein